MNRRERRAAAKQGNTAALGAALAATACRLEQAGKSQEAMEKYREALALNPATPGVANNLGNLLYQQGRLDEALGYFSSAILLEPASALSHNNLGNVYLHRKQFQEAGFHFQKASALDPKYADPHNGLGILLAESGQLEAAVKCYLQALEQNPGHLIARINLGTVLAKQGRMVEALDQAEIVSRSSEDPAFPHSAMGDLLARCGASDAALVCYGAHLARHPNDEEGIGLRLAALGSGPMPERASDSLLDRLYSNRASNWDEKAERATGYRGAELVASMLARLSNGPEKLDIIDVGCGTGLVGSLIAHKAKRLTGVDASLPMLEHARAKAVYQHLQHGDLVAFLKGQTDSCDAVTCAATLIHFGDLRPAFEAAAASLRNQGLFILTLFPNENEDEASVHAADGWVQGGCFKHGRNYVRRVAETTGFVVEAIEIGTHEYSKNQPVMGLVVALRRVRVRALDASAA
jgi:predicted TPR repeat methyltransferase/Flp pilus assembly protein TadD